MSKYVEELNPSYQEILKLDSMLTEAKVPHKLTRLFDGWQVCYPDDDPHIRVCDAIEHRGSYGVGGDMLELMGLLSEDEMRLDSVKGWMTAQEVFDRVIEHFKSLS